MKIFSKDIFRFIIVGISTVIVDYLLYFFLVNTSSLNIDLCKTISFLVGTLYAYVTNKIYTFKSNVTFKNSIYKFILLYTLSLFVNVFTNSLLLNYFNKFAFQLAFLISTFLSAFINFLGMKYFVFKKSTLND